MSLACGSKLGACEIENADLLKKLKKPAMGIVLRSLKRRQEPVTFRASDRPYSRRFASLERSPTWG